jgi:catechol 2,3-dioxygenase-like lactoylglutathione lyase family enzyme
MEMKLEVVIIPVSDVDRAKRFYERLGWRLDADFVTGPDFRVVQLTPPGSDASIIFGKGLSHSRPGTLRSLLLAVNDVEKARSEIEGRGITISEVFHDAGGVFPHAGSEARVPGRDPENRDYLSWAGFKDPDGNEFYLQEIRTRRPGRGSVPPAS